MATTQQPAQQLRLMPMVPSPALALGETVFLGQFGNGPLSVVKGVDRAVLQEALMADQEDRVAQLLDELRVARSLAQTPHALISDLHFVAHDANRIYIGMELEHGDLETLIDLSGGPLPVASARTYTAEVCLALEHLHSYDVVHCDVTPSNVKLGADGHVKLAGLGSCKPLAGRTAHAPPEARVVGLRGDVAHMSPEMLCGFPMSQVSDWWSAGALVYFMVSGRPLFDQPTVQSLVAAIVTFNPASMNWLLVHHVDHVLLSFLHGLLNVDQNARLGVAGAQQVLQHEWLAGVDVGALLRKQVAPPTVPLINLTGNALPPTLPIVDPVLIHARGHLVTHGAPWVDYDTPGGQTLLAPHLAAASNEQAVLA